MKTGDFSTSFAAAEVAFAQHQLADARELYLQAIAAEPGNVDVFRAILNVERLDELLAGRNWYGDERPSHHALSLFGSMFENGDRPYLHYAFIGQTAYEAFTTAYYLQDLLRLRRFDQLIQPTFLLIYLAIAATRSRRAEFIELGSTLYAAHEKLANCERVVGPIDCTIDRIGIELSAWLRQVAEALHPGVPIRHFAEFNAVPSSIYPRFALSLGVANYAFTRTTELVDWLSGNRLSVIRERFTLGPDFVYPILGKRFTCFDLDHLMGRLRAGGYRTTVLSFAEPAPFLPPDTTEPDLPFVDAYLLIDNLDPSDRDRLVTLLRRHDAGRFQSGYNTNPPFSLAAEKLFAGPEISDIRAQCQRRSHRLTEARALTTTQFDFGSPELQVVVRTHLENLDRIYR